MEWGFLWLMLALKLPLLALCWLVWWAIKQVPDAAEEYDGGSDDGGSKVDHPRDPRPRQPRRGPHRDAPPASPPRIRAVAQRAHTPER